MSPRVRAGSSTSASGLNALTILPRCEVDVAVMKRFRFGCVRSLLLSARTAGMPGVIAQEPGEAVVGLVAEPPELAPARQSVAQDVGSDQPDDRLTGLLSNNAGH